MGYTVIPVYRPGIGLMKPSAQTKIQAYQDSYIKGHDICI
jgi:hypothetical protein